MGNDIRKTIRVLTRETSNQWFRRMKNHLIAEDLWRVVEAPHRIAVTTNTPTSSANTTPSIIPGPWDDKANAKATLHIQLCLDENDEEDTSRSDTAYAIWKFLENKYKEKLQTTSVHYLREYITHMKPSDKTVEETVTYFRKLGRKIASIEGGDNSLFQDRKVLSALLRSLPDEYAVIKDAIEVQQTPDFHLSLQKILEKEAQLKDKEIAMWAKRDLSAKQRTDRSKSRRPRRSSSSGSNDSRRQRPSKSECFLCHKGHFVRDCPYLQYAEKKVQALRNKKTLDQKKPVHKHKHRAYNAEDNTSSGGTSADDKPNDMSDDSVSDELAALSKEEEPPCFNSKAHH